MNTELNTIARLLGAAQLAVFAGAMVSERLLASVVSSGSISEVLVNVSNNPTRVRLSNLVALLTSVAIIVLGVMFYAAFHQQYKIIALVALACFVAEGITLAVGKMGVYALVPLSQEFVEAGAPETSHFQSLGSFLYHGLDRTGYNVHMLFFCLGAILWYYLLVASSCIPRALSIWGLAAVCLLTLPVLLVLINRNWTYLDILALPYAPFELVLGIWLLVKGFS